MQAQIGMAYHGSAETLERAHASSQEDASDTSVRLRLDLGK